MDHFMTKIKNKTLETATLGCPLLIAIGHRNWATSGGGPLGLGHQSLYWSLMYGLLDYSPSPGIHCWDMAAGALIVSEAGGVVLDPSSGQFDLMSCDILVCRYLPPLVEAVVHASWCMHHGSYIMHHASCSMHHA